MNKAKSNSPIAFFPPGSLLSNTAFLNLWAAQMLTQVGVRLFDFVLAIQIYRQTGSNASVSYLILSYSLPAFLFSSLAGVLVDKWRKKIALVTVNFLRFVLVLAFIPFHQGLFPILLFAFLLSTVSQFFVPIEAVLLPRIVSKKNLMTAISFFTLTLYSSAVFGFMGAGPLIKSVGDKGAFVFISLMFLTATLMSVFLPIERKSKLLDFNFLKGNTLKDSILMLRNGLQIILSRDVVKTAIVLLGFSQVIVAMFMSLTPGLSAKVLRLTPEDASVYLIGPAALGMVMGAVLLSRLGTFLSKRVLVRTGLIGSILVFLLLSLLPEVDYLPFEQDVLIMERSLSLVATFGIILALFAGLFNSFITISCNTLLQEYVSYKNRGKVFGFLQTIIAIAGALPIIVSGISADKFGITNVYKYLSVIILLVLFFSYRFLNEKWG